MADLAVLTLKIASQQAEQAAKRTETKLDRLDRSAKRASTSMRTIGVGLSAAFTAPVLLAGRAALRAAANFESAQIAFEVFTGSAKKGKKVFNDLVKMASKTPLRLEGLQTAAQLLLATDAEGEDLVKTLTHIGNAARGNGPLLQRLALNFSQVASQSKLTGRDLRDFDAAGVSISKTLAKNLGKTVPQIREMVSAGKIGFKEVQDAFASMSAKGGGFHNMMQRMSQTLSGKWTTAVDNASIALASMVQPAIEPLKNFLDIFIRTAKRINSLSAETKKTIVLIAGALAALGPAILLAIGAPAIAAATVLIAKLAIIAAGVDAVRKMFGVTWEEIGEGAMKAGKAILGFVVNIKENFGKIGNFIKSSWTIITKFIGENWKNILSDVIRMVIEFSKDVIGIIEGLSLNFGRIFKAGIILLINTIAGGEGARNSAKMFGMVVKGALEDSMKGGLLKGFKFKTPDMPDLPPLDLNLNIDGAQKQLGLLKLPWEEGGSSGMEGIGGGTPSTRLAGALEAGSREAIAAINTGQADSAIAERKKNTKANEKSSKLLENLLDVGVPIRGIQQINSLSGAIA